MPKLQDYPMDTELNLNNIFLTEKENTEEVINPTSKTKLSTIGNFLWTKIYQSSVVQKIMDMIQSDYKTMTISKDWSTPKITFHSNPVDYWSSDKQYYRGDIVRITPSGGRQQFYWCISEHTSSSSWDNDNSYWELVSAQPYYTPVSFQPDGWSDTTPYTQTVSCNGSQVNSAPLVDIYFNDYWNNSLGISYTQQLESYSCVNQMKISEDGKITAICFGEKPTTLFQVKVKYVYDAYGDGDCFLMGRTLFTPITTVEDTTNITDTTGDTVS